MVHCEACSTCHAFVDFFVLVYAGDTERKIVIGTRFGASEKMPLYFSWFRRDKMVGNKLSITLYKGDLYVMSEGATGHTWKTQPKKELMVRHASGAMRFTKDKPHE